MSIDGTGTRCLTAQRYSLRISAKVADLLLHPLQGLYLIEHAQVGREVRVVRGEESCEHLSDGHF